MPGNKGQFTLSDQTNYKNLDQLGQQSNLPGSPEEAVLETVANPHAGLDYVTRFTCPEFTSLCPVTGQPDFAHLVIDYVPGKLLVESKSLKLYMGSFRNHGAFHEQCTLDIARRLVDELSPKWLRIAGYWYPRGGIPIDVFYQTGPAPDGVWVPDTGVPPYRGRG
jgi:7-cyano-7-deazaguanine reductase